MGLKIAARCGIFSFCAQMCISRTPQLDGRTDGAAASERAGPGYSVALVVGSFGRLEERTDGRTDGRTLFHLLYQLAIDHDVIGRN